MSGRGQDREFEEFAIARTPHLYRAAWLLCGDAHQAEDLVQETLAKVYVRMGRRFAGRVENPAAYAQTALVRTFLSHRRRKSSQERPYAEPPDRPDGDHADATGLRLALLDALAGLPAADRAVLVLRYLEDLSVEEVAARLDVSPGAVRNRSMRALAKVRPLLDPSLATTRPPGRDREEPS